MKLEDVLVQVNTLKPNTYDDDILIGWVSDLEWKMIDEIWKTHETTEDTPEYEDFNGYTEDDMSTELMVPDRYAEVYKLYLYAQIDFNNNETVRYQTSVAMFNSAFQTYANYYNRTHMPNGTYLKVF
jgi:hypothetical protein